MMSKNDWTDKLRDQLVDYEAPTTDDLWPAIEHSLAHGCNFSDSKHVVGKCARIVSIRRWTIAAAACAVIGIGVALVYDMPSYDEAVRTSSQRVAVKNNKRNIPLSEKSLPAENENGNHFQMSVASSSSILRRSLQLTSASRPSDSSMSEVVLASSLDASSDTDQISRQMKPKEQPITQKAKSVSEPFAAPDAYIEEGLLGLSNRHPQKVGWSMKLYAENGFVGGKGTFDNGAYLMASSDVLFNSSPMVSVTSFVTAKEKLRALLSAENVVEKHHHQPLSIGAQVGVRLGSKLLLGTGVTYTRVSSDFATEAYGSRSDISQTLHYVGIPVSLGYELLSVYGFHSYVSVGAEADVNVKNDTKMDGARQKVKRDRMQWSTNASLGIQYDVVPQLGIYVEPGLRYYIDNGSNIDNIFKYKKLNFGMQFGLRWNIK